MSEDNPVGRERVLDELRTVLRLIRDGKPVDLSSAMMVIDGEVGISGMLAMQAAQQRLWYDKRKLDDADRGRALDELLHGLHEEVGELARIVRTKPHVAKPERPIKGNATEEMVDVIKYLMAIADLLDIDGETLMGRYRAKTHEVEQRQHQRRLDLEGRRVFVTDLDECVADLGPFFSATGGMYGSPSAGLLETERRKAEWYDSGGFLDLPVKPGARQALLNAKAEGCLIAIITARPTWEHFRVRSDTVAWLKRHGIPHDIIVFNKDKWDALYQNVLPAKVIGFVEDRDKHALELAKHGVAPLFLMDRPWNEDFNNEQLGIQRVSGWDDIMKAMEASNWGRVGDVIPHDPERCQADKPNGAGPFTLGGRPGYVRCSNPPKWVATENTHGKDGKVGSMSLCDDCRDQMIKQGANFGATITPISEAP